MKRTGSVAWPAVIIGGAPRCGTTSLYDMLIGTGAYRPSPRKELFVLNDKSFWIQGSTPGHADVGERCYELAGFLPEDTFVDASTTYLYQDTAPAACADWLAAHQGHPFVVVFCLREPAARIYSSFQYFRDVLLQIAPQVSFASYAESLLEGKLHSGNQQVDQALAHGMYPEYLRRWRSAVGSAHLLLVRTEEIAADPESIVARISSRLGIAMTVAAAAKSNQGYRPRFRAAQKVARRLGHIIPHGSIRERLKSVYASVVPRLAVSPPDSDDEAAIEQLRNHYRPHRAAFNEFGLDWYGAE